MNIKSVTQMIEDAQVEYRAAETHSATVKRKLTKWENRCRNNARVQYRSALVQAIDILVQELKTVTFPPVNGITSENALIPVKSVMPPEVPKEAPPDIEQDIEQGAKALEIL